MGLLSDIVNAVVTATATIINVVVKTSVEIIDAATDAWNDYQRNRALNRLPPAEQIKEKARDELKEVNNEILSLLDKYNERGRLSETDRKRAESLNHQRAELMQTISGAAESAVAGEISHEPDAFEKLLLSNERAHILQGQVGVSVFGKKCPICNRDMLIQWPRSVTTVELADFFLTLTLPRELDRDNLLPLGVESVDQR
ncbi:unnamed protein product [marine sediment metagenome]|uniref:Uncharacterized protein n=1 Tax=marine sediment metagenome TaxID=412755 RepID=X0ZQC3_9ZZZZ